MIKAARASIILMVFFIARRFIKASATLIIALAFGCPVPRTNTTDEQKPVQLERSKLRSALAVFFFILNKICFSYKAVLCYTACWHKIVLCFLLKQFLLND